MRAQTTVEYLLLIVMVVILALLFAGIAFVSIGSVDTEKKINDAQVSSLPVGITAILLRPQSEYVVELRNNDYSRVNIQSITLNSSSANFDLNLSSGQKEVFNVPTSDFCRSSQKILVDILINYYSRYGLEKNEFVENLVVYCEDLG